MAKLKSKRAFLESAKESNSFFELTVDGSGYVTLLLADCDRRITWYFGQPNTPRAKRKIAKLKALVDSMYNHLHGVE